MDGARGWFWEAVEPFPSLVQLASCIASYFNIIYYAESLSLLIIINKAASTSSYKVEPQLSALWNSVTVLSSNNTQTKSFYASSQFKYLQYSS